MLDTIGRVISTVSLSAYIGKLGRVAIVVSLSACSGSSVVLLGPLSTSDSGSTQLEPPTFDPPNGFSFQGSSADHPMQLSWRGDDRPRSVSRGTTVHASIGWLPRDQNSAERVR
jgi:hypothetical protein